MKHVNLTMVSLSADLQAPNQFPLKVNNTHNLGCLNLFIPQRRIIWKCEFSWHGFPLQQILLDSSCLMLKFQSYFECFSSILSIELLQLFSHIITFTKSPYQMQFPFHEIVHMWIYFCTLFYNQENLTLIRCTPVGDSLKKRQ